MSSSTLDYAIRAFHEKAQAERDSVLFGPS